ncbi:MAG TPA: DNA (cytosine-5-)-methyltransferase [Candidatus Desulfofervidus auxilii]|uniref:Cytosine-specific methyltransferase n=1 Tax=Desulfofervidus auxilii TaxID=1621989 RepID=A0A7C0Y8F2_DESA2|nr:MAG: DNA (cytosine-5-)-methyltransferase [Spirochaetota bacterium]HDD45090.1 DNA (cytosine-5-)-methyltransferase [Candidatus Desulfofervidus auxilii]
MIKAPLTYIELFAGAGGLAEGLLRTGFEPIAHIEMDRYAALTLKTRLSYHYFKKNGRLEIYYEYLKKNISREELYNMVPAIELNTVINAEITNKNIPRLINLIRQRMEQKKVKKVDVLVGGPPCQAYSIIGRARDPYKMKNDKRNYLYRLYVKFLKIFKPSVFIFENVPGLLSAGNGKLWQDIQNYFKNAGYKVEYRLLNAHDFGVLQNRKRVIVIGWRKELNLKYPEFEKDSNVSRFRVIDILDDLPPLKPGERIYTGAYIKKPSEYLKMYGIRDEEDILTLHIARKHNKRDREIYRFYIEAWLKEKRRPNYDELPEELKTHRNRRVFKDRFKVVAPDLPYSQTVVAHLEKDGHYFIHPDINQLRSISVREAARLQSFPDNFYFEGPMTAMFRQIGNAVPPLMAEKIAKKIKEMIE